MFVFRVSACVCACSDHIFPTTTTTTRAVIPGTGRTDLWVTAALYAPDARGVRGRRVVASSLVYVVQIIIQYICVVCMMRAKRWNVESHSRLVD